MKKMRQFFATSLISAAVSIAATQAFANTTADYFARFKYTLPEAIELLKKADGKPMADVPEARNLLDDMGYWKNVRQETVLHFTPELQAKVEAQFQYLKKAYTYEKGDLVWVKAENAQEKTYGIGAVNHRAQIVDHASIKGTDYYTVEVLVDGAEKMVSRTGKFYDGRKGSVIYYGPDYELKKVTKVLTKTELDTLNSPGSSLPEDKMGEVLDWKNDQVWRDKLEQFKVKMAQKNFEIDFRAEPAVVEAKQQELMLDIFRHFKMNRNAPSNSGKGIGMRACGGGVCFDQALVLTYAIQGVGQTLGIKAFSLSGTTVNPQGGHGFVRYDLKTKDQVITFDKQTIYESFADEQARLKAAGQPVPTQDTNIPTPKGQYAGVGLKTSTWTGISDPGWADYGVTPDQFARVPVSQALNPLPTDSNRAVNGMSSQRNMVDVAQQIHAKGPMNTFSAQTSTTLDAASRAKVLEEMAKGKDLKNAVAEQLGVMTCGRVL